MLRTLIVFVAGCLLANVPVHADDRPVKVFILAGQSNMEGQGIIVADPKRNGGKGSLEYLVKEPGTAARFGHLVGKDGKWGVRDDVWISYLDRQGALTVGYGPRPDRIGPARSWASAGLVEILGHSFSKHDREVVECFFPLRDRHRQSLGSVVVSHVNQLQV